MLPRTTSRRSSGKNIFHDVAVNIGQSKIPPCIAVSQLFMIQTE